MLTIRHTCIILSLLLFGSALHCAEPKIVFPADQWQTATPESQGVRSRNVQIAMDYMESICGEVGHKRSMLIRNGYVIWQGDDVERVDHMWSCSKSIMSMSFGLLYDDGTVKPDMLANGYWPALADDYPDVTLQHLATMSSGISFEKGEAFSLKPPQHKPGTHYHYNSAQPNTLSYICTSIAGESMKDLFTRRIAEPIGMPADSWSWGSQTHPDGTIVNGGSGRPKSGVAMNASSMGRIGWLLANKGKWNDQQLLSEEYINYATHSLWPLPEMQCFQEKGWYRHVEGCYGFLFWVNGVRRNGKRMWPNLTDNTFALQGNKNHICIVIPEWRMVLVRMGGDKNINCDLYDAVLLTIKDGMRDTPLK